MNKKDIIDFFDSRAQSWDETNLQNEAVINKILDAAGIRTGISVYDIACGTGVLFPYYKQRGVGYLTAIDMSPQMVRVAREKHPDVSIRCNDVFEIGFIQEFDAIVVYNAIPHFENPAALIKHLSSFLKLGGRLTVAHGMSRAKINHVHSDDDREKISMGLLSELEMASLFPENVSVDVCVSDDEKYIVSGVRIR